MKKLVQINTVCNGSTGKIMGEIQRTAEKNGFEAISFYGRRKGFKDIKCEKISNNFFVLLHGGLTLLFNNHGSYSNLSTYKLINKLRKINPDIIQLHNIHGYYLNYKILFDYLKNEYNGQIFWTFHDCWPFTGHCAYFDYISCDKWEKKCENCPQVKSYPYSLLFDTSKKEFVKKNVVFNGIKNLTIITPSSWLKNLMKKSYLKKYKVEVINNGIDLSLFKTNKDLKILEKYNIPKNKKILLGVANIWEKRKGFYEFIKLSKTIEKNIVIVLVGLNKKQIASLPDNIIGITRTDNQKELIELYSISDLFINPTLEDNYPTVNIEAIACGTPVLTYDTGGCKEQIDKTTGFVCKNFDDLINKINYCLQKNYKKNIFDNKTIIKKIDAKIKYQEYIDLYNMKMKEFKND